MFREALDEMRPPPRVEEIFRRHNERQEELRNQEAERRIADQEMRRVKLSQRSEMLAARRRRALEDGTFRSIRNSKIQPES